MEETRTRFQKLVLIALAVMAVGYGVLTACSHLFFQGVVFEDALLRPEIAAERAVYTGKAHGDPVTIAVVRESETAATVEYTIGDWLHDVCRVEYPLAPIRTERGELVDGIRVLKNGRVLFEGGYDGDLDYGWYDQNGAWAPMITVSAGFAGDGAWAGYETTAADAVRFALGPERTARGSAALYLLMVVLSGLAALDAAFPLAVFRIRHCCDVRDPEPSDFYIATLPVCWVVCVGLIFIGYVQALRVWP